MADPGIWDLGGTSNSLADAIRRQAASQAKQSKAKSGLVQTEVDPFQQLMQQIQSINVQATPYEQLLQQATGTAGSQFDPLIKQLEAEMASTKQRGQSNQKEARQMYNALASDIAGEIPEITNQMAAASKEAEGRYNATQQELQNQYSQQAEEQAALFKKLGIQAAAPEASQQAMEDQAYFQNQSNMEEADALQMLQEMKNSDVSYTRDTAQNTRLAGVNTAQDIAAQLEQYLQQAGGKMSGLRAGRESAIQGMLAQLQQQDSQRIQEQEEREYNRLMDMFNLQLKMQELAGKQSGANSLFKGTNGMSGPANYLSEIYGTQGDTFTSNAIMDAINDVMSDPTVIAGKYNSGETDQYGQPITNKVNEAYLEDLLRKRMSGAGQGPLSGTQFSDLDIANAINALLARQGKLK
jgi:hypothetical protein